MDIKKINELQEVIESQYMNFSMKSKIKFYDDWAVDCPYDYAKWIFAHIDDTLGTDIRAEI